MENVSNVSNVLPPQVAPFRVRQCYLDGSLLLVLSGPLLESGDLVVDARLAVAVVLARAKFLPGGERVYTYDAVDSGGVVLCREADAEVQELVVALAGSDCGLAAQAEALAAVSA